MEKFDFEPVPNDSEKQEKYHYPEVMNELRPAVVSLVKQLKEAIERGDYQTIISDESRGRIPTLVLRKIFKDKSPNARDLQTYFLVFGRGEEADDDLKNFIAKHRDTFGKILVVTEFIHGGTTLKKLYRHFETENDFKNYDVATVFSNQSLGTDINKVLKGSAQEQRQRRFSNEPEPKWTHTLFRGQEVQSEPKLKQDNVSLNNLGGVDRRSVMSINTTDWGGIEDWIEYRKTIGAHPDTLKNLEENPEPSFDVVKNEQKRLNKYGGYGWTGDRGYQFASQEEEDKILSGLREKVEKKKLSEEEMKNIQDVINNAREDVDTLAKAVIEEVWEIPQNPETNGQEREERLGNLRSALEDLNSPGFIHPNITNYLVVAREWELAVDYTKILFSVHLAKLAEYLCSDQKEKSAGDIAHNIQYAKGAFSDVRGRVEDVQFVEIGETLTNLYIEWLSFRSDELNFEGKLKSFLIKVKELVEKHSSIQLAPGEITERVEALKAKIQDKIHSLS